VPEWLEEDKNRLMEGQGTPKPQEFIGMVRRGHAEIDRLNAALLKSENLAASLKFDRSFCYCNGWDKTL
jgi:hypothetical protein